MVNPNESTHSPIAYEFVVPESDYLCSVHPAIALLDYSLKIVSVYGKELTDEV